MINRTFTSKITAVTLVTLFLGALVGPVHADITSSRLTSDSQIYYYGNTMKFTVQITFDTTGYFGYGCLRFGIDLYKYYGWWTSLWFWPHTDKLASDVYNSDMCYLGTFPNPVIFTKIITISTTSIGTGQSSIYADTKVSCAAFFNIVTRWCTGSTAKITVNVY